MERLTSFKELEMKMEKYRYKYSKDRIDQRRILLTLANNGCIYAQDSYWKRQYLFLKDINGRKICYLTKKRGVIMKIAEEENKYQKIVRKVKGMLAISRDSASDEESQSAFLMAQKLMLEYNIAKQDVEDVELAEENIGEESVTIYKKLFWWERELGEIIAKNFRVKVFYTNKRFGGSNQTKSKIMFYGFGKDLELAKEMYLLAYEVMLHHSKVFIEKNYEEFGWVRERYYTESMKASYIRGFLKGLEVKFNEQVSVLRQQYEVMILMPVAVQEKYDKMAAGFDVYAINYPKVEVEGAYEEGYSTGKSIDFTRSTVGTTDYSSLIGKYIVFSQGSTSNLHAKIISVKAEYMQLLIMNTTSCPSSMDVPTFYDWELSVHYAYAFATPEYVEIFERYLKSDDKRVQRQITEALKACRKVKL
ncbi:DUF2786 domain-containing protein [Listeria rocourtiae]|uniref:DUF2786 domain-containing protein n=1 Tax=Listeria rocourtiae TaxID=647910 RepID=UPI001625F7C1|nr:DUF2786 domain-containing protein [Listeria rocourtiae]MBC1604503.1 DUF2786 domain-containing protein [Listeria rocourtiae]